MLSSRPKRHSAPKSRSDALRLKADLLDAMPQCVFMTDASHVVLSVNAGVASLLGGNESVMVGKTLTAITDRFVDSSGKSLTLENVIDRCIASREAELLESWLKPGVASSETPDDQMDQVSITVIPISGDGEQSKVAVIIDGEAVQQPYALRDAVLSMVSHELRTPLLHIKGFVSTLLESDIQWDEETRMDFLHTIDREADRLTTMVSDLVEITRMGSVDLPLHLEETDLYLLAHAAIDFASPYLRKHRVLVEIDEKLAKVQLDSLRVMGVIGNLLQNASKYTAEGTTITIDATRSGSEVTFSVADQGEGIPPEAQKRIFSMFYRGDQSIKKSPGTGLGLAVCKAVVDAHGGKIWVESEPGNGSVFKFTIPTRKRRRRASSPRTRRANKAAKSASQGESKPGRAVRTGDELRSRRKAGKVAAR